MREKHPSRATLLDLAAGRPDEAALRHAGSCRRCAAALRFARVLLDLGRAARAVRGPGAEVRRRAEGLIRGLRPHAARPAARPRALPLLALLFDSWARPAAAIRSAGTASERLLRLGGEDLALDVHLRRGSRGFDLRGSLEVPASVRRVEATAGGRTVTAAVDDRGEFELRGLPRGHLRLVLDGRVAAELDL